MMKMVKAKKTICLIFSMACLICISGCSSNTATNSSISKSNPTKSCESQKTTKDSKKYKSPLVCIYSNYAFNTIEEIYVDADTKNMYLFREIDSGGGMVQLTAEDGSPKKFEGNLDEYIQY